MLLLELSSYKQQRRDRTFQKTFWTANGGEGGEMEVRSLYYTQQLFKVLSL